MKGLKEMQRVLSPLALALAILGPGSVCAQSETGEYADPPVRGDQAPAFSGAGIDGTTITLPSFRGKVVLLEFWATWCGPCHRQIPRLVDLHKKYHPYGLQIVGVSLDENRDALEGFLEQHPEIDWPQVIDDKQSIAKRYGVKAIPREFLLDWNGQVYLKHSIHTDVDVAILICENIHNTYRRSHRKRPGGVTAYHTKPGPSLPARTIEFPKTFSMGRLYIRNCDWTNLSDPETPKGQGWRFHSEARGSVRIPRGKDANLLVSKDRWSDLSPLARLNPGDLQKITLAGAKFDGAQLEHIQDLSGLKELDFHESSVTNDGLRRLDALTSLRKLLLQNTGISDRGLADIGKLASLEKLNLAGTQITDSGLEYLDDPPFLRWLNLYDTRVTEFGLRHLADTSALEILQVSGNIVDAGLMYVSRLPSLKVLDITSPLIGDAGLAMVAGMSSLEHLSITSARITEGGLEHLKSMKSLKYLFISMSHRERGLAPLAVVKLQQALPGCEIVAF